MQDSRLVQATTLLFATGSLVFLVIHASVGAGCASTPAGRALPPMATNAQAGPGTYEGANGNEPAATVTAAPDDGPPPSYLGATKAAGVYHPPPQAPVQKSNAK